MVDDRAPSVTTSPSLQVIPACPLARGNKAPRVLTEHLPAQGGKPGTIFLESLTGMEGVMVMVHGAVGVVLKSITY